MTDVEMMKLEDSKSVVFSVEISEEDYHSVRAKLTKLRKGKKLDF